MKDGNGSGGRNSETTVRGGFPTWCGRPRVVGFSVRLIDRLSMNSLIDHTSRSITTLMFNFQVMRLNCTYSCHVSLRGRHEHNHSVGRVPKLRLGASLEANHLSSLVIPLTYISL